jgi:hypothetical protein
MAQEIGFERLRVRWGGHALSEPRHDLLLDDRDQPRVDRLVDDEKGLAVHGIDPIVGGGPQTQALAGHAMAWQRGLAALVDAHMPVDVEHPALLGGGGHPALAQRRAPLRGLLRLGQQPDLGAQGAYLRDAVQPRKLAPLPRGTVAQRLDRLQPRQCHEGKQHQQAVEATAAFRQGQVTLDALQQSHRQQGGQRAQQAAMGHVQRWGKAGGHRRELANTGSQASLHIRRAHAHGGGAVGG